MKLTKTSEKLMSFFTKNEHLLYQKQKNKTKELLKVFYYELIEGYTYIKKYKDFKKSIKKISDITKISRPKYFNSNSFPRLIKEHIDNTIMTELSYTFSLYDRKITVIYILENDDVENYIHIYDEYTELIFIWLYILNLHASKECVNKLTIYIYFTTLEKKIPTSKINILNEYNVNTAFTTTCPKDYSEIVVFRKEEWFKVLIHETIHNFGLDFSNMNNDNINNFILNIFNVNSHVNAYEAYTEFWAEIINACFCSFNSLKDINNLNHFLSNCEFYINFEITYSFFQLVKILNFMGLSYNDLYSNSIKSGIARDNFYKEKTSVLSYYIIKTILINNYQGFLNWCQKNNSSIINFKKTYSNQMEFCKFIERNYKTQEMLNNIYVTNIFYSEMNNKKNQKEKDIFLNLRMSICELG